MKTMELQYEQYLKSIAEKWNRFSFEELKRFKDLRVGFEHGWEAARKSQWQDAEKENPSENELVVIQSRLDKRYYIAKYQPEFDDRYGDIPVYRTDDEWLDGESVIRWMYLPD